MVNNKKPEYWVPDSETYNQLQKLKKFVDFVAGLPVAFALHKQNADKIKDLIETINQPETIKDWWVCLDVTDLNIQGGNGTGIYWKKWSVNFEFGKLEIESTDEILDEQKFSETYENYYGCIYFAKDIKGERIYMDTDIDEFIADAMNYESYLTEGLKDIEVDIDIFVEFKQRHDAKEDEIVKYNVKINLGNKDMIEPWER
jgi:hypothetical protein